MDRKKFLKVGTGAVAGLGLASDGVASESDLESLLTNIKSKEGRMQIIGILAKDPEEAKKIPENFIDEFFSVYGKENPVEAARVANALGRDNEAQRLYTAAVLRYKEERPAFAMEVFEESKKNNVVLEENVVLELYRKYSQYLEQKEDILNAARYAKRAGEEDRAKKLYTKSIESVGNPFLGLLIAHEAGIEDEEERQYGRIDGYKIIYFGADNVREWILDIKKAGMHEKAQGLYNMALKAYEEMVKGRHNANFLEAASKLANAMEDSKKAENYQLLAKKLSN